MNKPRLFFDTNILETLASSPLYERVRKYLSARYTYVISPLTVDELLLGIKGGDEQFFDRNQAKMKVLRGVGQMRILRPPATFVLKQVLGVHVNPPTASVVEIEKCIDVVLRAHSKGQLEQGLVPLRNSRKTGGLNFDPIEQRHNLGKAEHARILESLRAKELRKPKPNEWVKTSFRHFNLELADSEWSKVASALDAAVALNLHLCDLSAGDRYDFSRHYSDWIDLHQLFYLCDPNVSFLTNDKPLRNRVAKSDQIGRIVMLEDILGTVTEQTALGSSGEVEPNI